MQTLAAILVETGRPLELAEIDIPPLATGQALVEIACSGVCHTQLLEARGHRGPDPYLPHCLGHEGSGIVVEIGPGVTKVKPGDQVILSWMKGAGANVAGVKYGWNGRTVNAGGVTTFQRHAVVSENRLTPMPAGLSFEAAALVGCAVATGAGVVMNTAAVRPGQSVAVFGTGGIGVCAVSAAALSGAMPLIAVDIDAGRRDAARAMGASHVVDPLVSDPVDAIRALVPGGVDVAIEASGRPDVMAQALLAVREQGGTAVVVGNARHGESIALDPRQLNLGKRLLGTWGGDNQPDRDFPRYCRLIEGGRLPVAPLLSPPFPLERINDALDALESRTVPRPLVRMA